MSGVYLTQGTSSPVLPMMVHLVTSDAQSLRRCLFALLFSCLFNFIYSRGVYPSALAHLTNNACEVILGRPWFRSGRTMPWSWKLHTMHVTTMPWFVPKPHKITSQARHVTSRWGPTLSPAIHCMFPSQPKTTAQARHITDISLSHYPTLPTHVYLATRESSRS